MSCFHMINMFRGSLIPKKIFSGNWFFALEVIRGITNGSNDFFKTRFINVFLDAFSNELLAHYRIIG